MVMSLQSNSPVTTMAQPNDEKLRKLCNQSGLLMLEQVFIDQLQTIYDEENDMQDGESGYYRELIPFFVTAALKNAPELGIGAEIYKEIGEKVNPTSWALNLKKNIT